MTRRLLVVSYHFPPSVAVGGLRWQRMSQFAEERGWEVDVVALEPDEHLQTDPARARDLPPGLRTFGVPARGLRLDAFTHWASRLAAGPRASGEPGGGRGVEGQSATEVPKSLPRAEVRWSADLATLRRTWHAWRAFRGERDWAVRAAAAGLRVVRAGVHRAVISCGPPHGVHLAGRWIAESSRLPFVMDMRDPWSQQQRLVESVASPLWYRIAEAEEGRAVARSALVACNTEPAAAAMRLRYPAARVITVMNGTDELDIPPVAPGGRFVLGYAGSVYLDRDPAPLFRACASVVRELGLAPAEFGVEFIGYGSRYNGRSLVQIAEAEGLGPWFSHGAARPHGEAMAFLASCAMLVSLPQDSTLAIPSKVFEYLRFPAWVLALTERPSATATVLEGTEADVVAPHDERAIAAAVRSRYRQFVAAGRPEPLGRDPRLTRRHQAGLLLDALEEVTR